MIKRRIVKFIGLAFVGLMLIVLIILLSNKDPLDSTLAEIKENNYSGSLLIANGGKVLRTSSTNFASCDETVPNEVDTVVIAMSNRGPVPAEDIGNQLLFATVHELYLPHR